MKLQRSEYGALTVLEATGDLIGDDVERFHHEALRCLEQTGPNLIIDCAGIGGFDSSGLESLTALQRTCQERHGTLKLCRLDPVATKIFEMTRLAGRFDTYPDVEAAIRSCS